MSCSFSFSFCFFVFVSLSVTFQFVLTVGATQLSNHNSPICNQVWRGIDIGCTTPREVVCEGSKRRETGDGRWETWYETWRLDGRVDWTGRGQPVPSNATICTSMSNVVPCVCSLASRFSLLHLMFDV